MVVSCVAPLLPLPASPTTHQRLGGQPPAPADGLQQRGRHVPGNGRRRRAHRHGMRDSGRGEADVEGAGGEGMSSGGPAGGGGGGRFGVHGAGVGAGVSRGALRGGGKAARESAARSGKKRNCDDDDETNGFHHKNETFETGPGSRAPPTHARTPSRPAGLPTRTHSLAGIGIDSARLPACHHPPPPPPLFCPSPAPSRRPPPMFALSARTAAPPRAAMTVRP